MTELAAVDKPGLEDANLEGERIAKRLARAGIASRRDAERLIAERRVAVDGHVLDTPAIRVKPEARITVDGKPIAATQPTRLWRYHKPQGLVTTHRDPQGRQTVFESLPPGLPRVVSIGRLDLNSEGLLLLTNDGELARKLELPKTGWTRRYRVRVFGTVVKEKLESLGDGLVIDGIRYGPAQASLDPGEGDKSRSNAWLMVSLQEGKNREVRKILERIDLRVNRLIRVSYGPFQLGKLLPGAVEEISPRILREQLGQAAPKPESRRPSHRHD
jgi:23S rRNA pseudouridine2605 synthase